MNTETTDPGTGIGTLGSQRHLFDVPDHITYMNTANLAPRLRAVTEAGLAAVNRGTQPWTFTQNNWFNDAHKLRGLAARIMNARQDDVAIVPSVSYGIAIAAANLPIRAGQSIVILDQQFPSNVYAWRAAAKRTGAELRTVPRGADGTWTGEVLTAIDRNTAVVAVPNCHWTDGSIVDLRRVGAKARAVGAAFVIDASQSMGAMPIDVQELQPDFLACVGYKWMLGPYGLGYLYASPRWQEQGLPLEHSWITRARSENFAGLVDYTDELQPGARRFDMGEFAQFTMVPMAIAALTQLLTWGIDRIQATLSELTRQIEEGAKSFGGVAAPAENRGGHMIGIRLRGGLPEDLGDRLGAAQVFVSRRGDSIRVAPHLHNTAADVERLLTVLREAVAKG
jgi:selenocysteine lyase/cysteine desulfurase